MAGRRSRSSRILRACSADRRCCWTLPVPPKMPSCPKQHRQGSQPHTVLQPHARLKPTAGQQILPRIVNTTLVQQEHGAGSDHDPASRSGRMARIRVEAIVRSSPAISGLNRQGRLDASIMRASDFSLAFSQAATCGNSSLRPRSLCCPGKRIEERGATRLSTSLPGRLICCEKSLGERCVAKK